MKIEIWLPVGSFKHFTGPGKNCAMSDLSRNNDEDKLAKQNSKK